MASPDLNVAYCNPRISTFSSFLGYVLNSPVATNFTPYTRKGSCKLFVRFKPGIFRFFRSLAMDAKFFTNPHTFSTDRIHYPFPLFIVPNAVFHIRDKPVEQWANAHQLSVFQDKKPAPFPFAADFCFRFGGALGCKFLFLFNFCQHRLIDCHSVHFSFSLFSNTTNFSRWVDWKLHGPQCPTVARISSLTLGDFSPMPGGRPRTCISSYLEVRLPFRHISALSAEIVRLELTFLVRNLP